MEHVRHVQLDTFQIQHREAVLSVQETPDNTQTSMCAVLAPTTRSPILTFQVVKIRPVLLLIMFILMRIVILVRMDIGMVNQMTVPLEIVTNAQLIHAYQRTVNFNNQDVLVHLAPIINILVKIRLPPAQIEYVLRIIS
jgi:hypothetical protein